MTSLDAPRGRPDRFGSRSPLRLLLVHAVLGAGAVVMLLPFVWMALTSIRPPSEILSGSLVPFPQTFHGIENYSAAFKLAPLGMFMLNGAIVCLGILVVQLLVAIPAAYAIAKLRFPGREVFFALVVAGLCVPIQVPALPLYLALAWAGLLDGYFALMVPFFLSVFAIFLFRQTFKTFPDEIIHAARVDGMAEFEILWRIVVPSAAPAIAAFSIFSVVAHWNDLYWPMIVIQRLEHAPPPVGMLFFAGSESGTNHGVMMAAAVIITAPLLLLFLAARRRFVQGITMTGIK
jgi:multiple sugar transport system permease protein